MFDNIAKRYDFLNHLLSLGIDRSWRRIGIGMIKPFRPKNILDVATGTGDLAIEGYKQLTPDNITGVDISEEMLAIGRNKIMKRGLEDHIRLQYGDSEDLQFEDNSFDAATVAFGVRNFANLEQGLKEIARVLKPGKHLMILEFSTPEKGWFKALYNAYFRYVTPTIGKLFSKEKRAYSYLPESVQAFPGKEAFNSILEASGLHLIEQRPLTFGICTAYLCEKQ